MLSPVLPSKLIEIFSFFGLNDKMEHFIAFFLLSFLLNRASSTIGHRLRNVSALLAFGIIIELVQYFIPSRGTSFGDVAADAMGIVVFQIVFSIYLYVLSRRKDVD